MIQRVAAFVRGGLQVASGGGRARALSLPAGALAKSRGNRVEPGERPWPRTSWPRSLRRRLDFAGRWRSPSRSPGALPVVGIPMTNLHSSRPPLDGPRPCAGEASTCDAEIARLQACAADANRTRRACRPGTNGDRLSCQGWARRISRYQRPRTAHLPSLSARNKADIASSSRGPGTERDIQRRALDWPTQRDPRSGDVSGDGTARARHGRPAGRSDVRPGLRTPRWRPTSGT